ncbi:UNVERIFIED_CONTAM: hypothetical protein GTU68_028320 [Idotea baltica]|nr:hypothetical protein [Idotea baltica]
MKLPSVEVRDLGRISYLDALDVQRGLHQELVAAKLQNRDLPEEERTAPSHYFIFCEHDPVFTLGRTGDQDHLLLSQEQLTQQNIDFHKTNRGGDITYHGPGQIVGYPIFDLDYFFTDVHRYVRYIEEAVIRTLDHFQLKGIKIEGFTGVWLDANSTSPQRKLCAIGIHLSRWVSMHGFALNVNTELGYFDKIVPCGISTEDKSVTSIQKELRRTVDTQEVKALLLRHFSELFGFEYQFEKISKSKR